MPQNLICIAFYNVENFYSKHSEHSFVPNSKAKWIEDRYEKKVNQIAFCLSKIGKYETDELPSIIGIAEVENEDVLQDLAKNEYLKKGNYKTLLYESLDERRINVGLMYRIKHFHICESEPIRFVFKDENNTKTYTRDILYVNGKLLTCKIHFFIVHLPSKFDKETNQLKRQHILKGIRKRIDNILTKNPCEQIVIMGDFNESPTSSNIIEELNTRGKKEEVYRKELYNPMVSMQTYKRGSVTFNRQWLLFDQQIFSGNFTKKNAKLKFIKTEIFDASFLKNDLGKSRGLPYRTFIGGKYLGGYSDHFPIYTILKY